MKNFVFSVIAALLFFLAADANADQCAVEIESQAIQIVADELRLDFPTVEKTWTRTIRLLSSGQIEIYEGEFTGPDGQKAKLRFSVDRMCDVIDFEFQQG